jgi:cytochrome c553
MRRLLLAYFALAVTLAPARSETFAERLSDCLECHGKRGQSEMPDTPSVGGQPLLFLMYQLVFFRAETRRDSPMNIFAKELTDDDVRAFAEAMAKLPPPRPPNAGRDAMRFNRGKAIADAQGCGACHNPDYSGREQMPRLAAQREDYLVRSMREYKSGKRVGQAAAMPEIMHGVSEEDIVALAHYFAHLR